MLLFPKGLLLGDMDCHVHLGDCIEHLSKMPAQSIDFSIYSPPFPAVFSYSNSPADLGNSEELHTEAKLHISWFLRQMLRVMKPGRVMMVHCTQIIVMKRMGDERTHDFRGLLIRLAKRSGFYYEYDWTIRKNPQAQAIRTRSRALQFKGLESDRADSRGAMPDFIIKFRAPGINVVPINDNLPMEDIVSRDDLDEDGDLKEDVSDEDKEQGLFPRKPLRGERQVTRNEWIEWAESHWTGISETDTLNAKEGRSYEDVKHICPLQLGVIDRLVRLYSNPGEIVFSPFAGIGSEGYQSIKLNRRFYGVELKPEYHAACLKNLARAIDARNQNQVMLWDLERTASPARPR